ncbi:MAG: biopolymer transporter ExbD [Rhodobacteraceae bacterium]|nr:biopolymer transporter ExbD [Paracoccaceae bacterium]
MKLNAGTAGRRRRSGSGDMLQPMAEINVTPFVDVVLVLLIIFIVAAPLLSVGVPIELPDTAAKALPASDETPLTLTINAAGQVAIQSSIVERSDLVPSLEAIMQERETRRIYLRGDGNARYEIIMQVMGALNNAGFNDIALVTDAGGPSLDGSGN